MPPAADSIASITDRLEIDLRRLSFAPPTAYVYDPLDYARPGWDAYCRRYARSGVPAILLEIGRASCRERV